MGIQASVTAGEWNRSEVPVRSALFVRRLAAITVLDLALGMVLASVVALVGVFLLGPSVTPPGVRVVIDWSAVRWMMLPGAFVAIVAAGFIMLLLWRREAGNARHIWYLRWKPHTFVLVLGVLLAVRWRQHMDVLAPAQIQLGSHDLHFVFGVYAFAMILIPTLWACIWMYWIARTNRSLTGMVVGALTWYLLRLVSGSLSGALLSLPLIVTVTVIYAFAGRLTTRYRDSQRGVPWISS